MPQPPFSSLQLSMASLHNRKRRNPDDITQEIARAKKIKSSAVRGASNYPPKFWDKLSKVWLTPRALRELDRRNDARQPSATSPMTPLGVTATTLARFATHGGPDLRHLRGCPEPSHIARISSNRSSASLSRRTLSTKATSVSSRAKRSSAYDQHFEQNLIDHNIFPKGYEYPDNTLIPEPGNLDDVAQAFLASRASLSPSRFNRSIFQEFARNNDRVISESNVMSKIIPIILGNANIPSEGNLPFANLDSMTDGTTVNAVPNLYDGSYTKDINKTVRQDLNKTIIPTSHRRALAAPNFFVEAKARRGGADVAKRQACLDGAVGARAMHSLQNYMAEPVYDGNAYSFSSTYHAGTGTLQLYAHHMTAPAAEGGLPEYHMTQIDSWGMTGNIDTFRRGAAAFRNARDMAQHHPETLIQAANTRTTPVSTVECVSGSHSEYNLRAASIDDLDATAWQDSHDDLQQHIAETCVEGNENNGEAPTTPQNHYSSDDSQGPGQNLTASGTDNPSMSFVSSFTSSFSTDTARPKRCRQSFSSPNQGSRSSKLKSA